MNALGIAVAIPFTPIAGGGTPPPPGTSAITDNLGADITDNAGNAITENKP